MTSRFWLSIGALAFAMTAIAPISQAQGKGKGQGEAKAEQGKAHGNDKAGKAPAPPAASRGPAMEKQSPGRSANAMPRVPDNRAVTVAHGRSPEKFDRKGPPAMVPVSPNASSRAIVATSTNPGRAVGRFGRDLHINEVRPPFQRFVVSNRPAEFVTGGAISYAFARGLPENALVIAPAGSDVWIRNRQGIPLIAIDDDRARNLGVWQVSPLAEPVREGAPSFCRSGAGHPVWGRQWCLQKGFGLGESQDFEWAAARDIGDLTFVNPVAGTLTRDALLNLLGQVAFDRLALHALTLGYTDPLTGFWRTDPAGPSVLFVNSGRYPIAELVDETRDLRPDLMLVALRPW